jgi:hydroxymethylglutaryl-CoA reductase
LKNFQYSIINIQFFMTQKSIIKGFSKLSPEEKLKVVEGLFDDPAGVEETLRSFFHGDPNIQKILSELSENTLSNYPLPFNVAPNFLINDTVYLVPMVTEESSVVAAASSAASFWAARGGFKAKVLGTQKIGQVHFLFRGDPQKLNAASSEIESFLKERIRPNAANMVRRGGGISSIELINQTHLIENYWQLHLTFETVDAMGANFINSVLEECSRALADYFEQGPVFSAEDYESLMSILSNHTPECLVEVKVDCPVEAFKNMVPGTSAEDFARRFVLAVEIAEKDIHRAATHNKGIMNGVDAVIIATGNDFRAIEAGAHAYAAKDGSYTSLSHAKVENGHFEFTLTMPMALGTTGGLTRLHPLADLSLKMLGNPNAKELMMIAAAAGMANNFAAVRSLTTTGIQAGHMRMHLPNILTQLGATVAERDKTLTHFNDQTISFQKVEAYLKNLRNPDG